MRAVRAVSAIAAVAAVAAAWLPFLRDPLTPDEGGFLLLGQHWTSGTSLYGNYWVDRPPLLIWLFSLCGPSPSSVRLLGLAAAVLAVLLGSLIARNVSAGSGWAAFSVPVLAAAFVSSPLFGMPETDGELLGLPFVMTGLVCTIAALRPGARRSTLAAAFAAGAMAMAAALVKQNIIDVFVFAAVAYVLARRHLDRPVPRAGAFVGGSVVMLALAVGVAALHGTSAGELWHAVVTFRFAAWKVIGTSAPEATSNHFVRELAAFVVSGAAAILAMAVWTVWRRSGRSRLEPGSARLVVPAAAMVSWEIVGVCLGGSYWLHYLTGVVPGALLLVALAGPLVRARSLLTVWLVFAVVASGTAWVHRDIKPIQLDDDERTAAYLREHAKRSDGVVVAFGHPNIVQASGLQSPYPDLWVLPVRVHDPHLVRFRQVITGPAAPRWIVVDGARLGSWGLRAGAARAMVRQLYVLRVAYGTWHIVERRE